MTFQNNLLVQSAAGNYQNVTWLPQSQCPFFGNDEYLTLQKDHATLEVLECANRILLGDLQHNAYFLFPSCFCDKQFNVAQVVSRYDTAPKFEGELSDVESLTLAIFKSDIPKAKELLQQESFKFDEKLDRDFVIQLALYLTEFEILQTFLESEHSVGAKTKLEYSSNEATRAWVNEAAKKDLESRKSVNHIIKRCLLLNTQQKHKAALWVAILKGHVDQAKSIIETISLDLNQAVSNGNDFPLQLAVQQNNQEMVNAFLDLGADPNAPLKGDVKALDLALRSKNLDMARLLVNRQARLEDVDMQKLEQSDSVDLKMAQFFVENGISLDPSFVASLVRIKNPSKDDILSFLDVCSNNNQDMEALYSRIIFPSLNSQQYLLAQELIKRGVSVDPDFISNHHLVNAAYNHGDIQTFKFVLEQPGASINEKCSFGEIPLLHQICMHMPNLIINAGFSHYEEKVDYTLNHTDIDLNILDKNGRTALHYLVELKNKALFERFLKMGARLDLEDHEGQKAQDLDTSEGQIFKARIEEKIRLDQEEKERLEQERLENERIERERLEREELIKKVAPWAIGATALAAALAILALYLKSKKSVDGAKEIDFKSLEDINHFNLDKKGESDPLEALGEPQLLEEGDGLVSYVEQPELDVAAEIA